MDSSSAQNTPSDLRAPHFNEAHGIEYTIHECPSTLYSTFKLIFPDLAPLLPKRGSVPSEGSQFVLNVIAVWQPTVNDMSGFSDTVQEERDQKTSKFIEWAKPLCSKIKEKLNPNFVDFVEPSSGLPYLCMRGNTIFIETDDAILNLGYRILDFGCCKAVSHPKWGTKSFMSIVLSDAKVEDLAMILQEHLSSN